MQKLGKLIGILIGIFAIIFLVVPFGVGFWLKSYDLKALARMSDMNPNIHADQVTYHRGWFSSDITTSLTLYVNEGAHAARSLKDPVTLTPVHFKLHTLLKHGPFLFDKAQEGSRFNMGWGLAHTTFLEPKIPVQADTRIGFSKIVSHLYSDRFQVNLPKLDMTLSGFDMVSRQHLDMKGGSFNGSLGQIAVIAKPEKPTEKPVTITVDKMTTQGHLKRQGVLGLGEIFVNMQQIKIADPEGSKALVATPKMHWQVSTVTNKLTFDFMSSVASVTVGKDTTGPYHINYKLSDIDVPTLTAFVKDIQAQSKTHKIAANAVMSGMMKILMQGLSLDVDAYGSLTNNELVALKGKATMAANAKPAFGIFSLLSGLKVEANVTLPESIAVNYLADYLHHKQLTQQDDTKATPQQLAAEEINAWVSQGLISKKAPNLSTKLSFEAGKLAVNDKPLSLF